MQSGFHAPAPATTALQIANRRRALRRIIHGETNRVDISSGQDGEGSLNNR